MTTLESNFFGKNHFSKVLNFIWELLLLTLLLLKLSAAVEKTK